MGDITTRDGYCWHDGGSYWEAYPEGRRLPTDEPCIVVTGDLDTAKRRLATPDDAAIERAARAIFKQGYPGAWTWTPAQRAAHIATARVALAAAEETPDA